MAGGIAALLLKADDKNRWSVILHHADGRETTLPSATPAEHLITASEIDYSAYRRLRSKTDFYRLFFEQLARKGFDVKRSQSSDYIADIYYKNQLVAYFSKADTVIQNPFVAVKDKVMRLINDTAQNTAVKVGICRDCPYTDANEKLPNGSYKLAEYNGVTLACKEHHLFGYVFSTYRTAPAERECAFDDTGRTGRSAGTGRGSPPSGWRG